MTPESFRRKMADFTQEKSGSVAILFALASVGVFLIVGLALDYSRAVTMKGILNTATDAAALAALSAAQSDYAANLGAAQMMSDAQAAAHQAFVANAGTDYSSLTQPPTITVTRTGQVINANVSYQAKSPNLFAALSGSPNMTVSHSGAASLTLPSYLNFYLLLDVSGSMGIPSTTSEINRLAAINPDYLNLYPGGCTLSCHFTAYNACQNAKGQTVACQGYNLSRNAGNSQNTPVNTVAPYYCTQPGTSACIQLRLDAVAYATQQLIQTAVARQNADHLPNQFGIGLYPFIRWMQPYQPLTTSLATVNENAAGLTALIDNGYGANTKTVVNGQTVAIGLGSGGTHFENALPAMNNVITTIGDGSSAAAPKPFVFLVTDGAQDNQYQQNNGSWTGSNHATTLDPANCATIKNRGITLAVLYVPYVAIPNPTTIWNDEDDYANANIPKIPPVLQSCASPGFFFEASSPADINNAMIAMFNMAVQTAHLTH